MQCARHAHTNPYLTNGDDIIQQTVDHIDDPFILRGGKVVWMDKCTGYNELNFR